MNETEGLLDEIRCAANDLREAAQALQDARIFALSVGLSLDEIDAAEAGEQP